MLPLRLGCGYEPRQRVETLQFALHHAAISDQTTASGLSLSRSNVL